MLKDSDLLGLKRAEYLHMISLYAWLCLNVCWFKDILITCITCCSVFQLHTINQVWLTDLALRLLCVLSLDRFGDYVSDEVSHSLYYWTNRTKLFHILSTTFIYFFCILTGMARYTCTISKCWDDKIWALLIRCHIVCSTSLSGITCLEYIFFPLIRWLLQWGRPVPRRWGWWSNTWTGVVWRAWSMSYSSFWPNSSGRLGMGAC